MAKANPLISNMNGGEASPFVIGRADLQKYPNLSVLLENFIVRVQGSASKRPGFVRVKDVKDSTKKVNLVPYIYSVTQSYVLEMGEGYIRYFANSGRLEVAGVPVENTTPYSQTDIFKLDYTQSLDVMYFVTGAYRPKELVRNSATSFSFADMDITGGPWQDQNTTDTTVSASAGTGTVTLTASADIFEAGHVGGFFEL